MLSLIRTFVLGAGSAAIALSQSGTASTPPSQARGYNLVFSEDFSSFDLSSNGSGTHQWYPGIYFDPALPAPASITVGKSTVSDSTLNLQWNRSSGQTNTSIESCAYQAGTCNTFRYGYFEAKMKWDVTTGAWPAFWMITEQGIWGESLVGELDIFEGQGSDPTHYFGTINEWNGPNNLVYTNSAGKNRFALPPGDSFSGWHTYGLLWVPGKVSWYFDNVEVGSAATPPIFDQQDFFIILGSQEGSDWTPGNLTGVAGNSINLGVDWVHVYQNSVPRTLTAVQQTTNLFAHPPALTFLTTMLPSPNSTVPYAVEPQAAGGKPPYTFAVTSGALPAGLTLSPSTGMISSTTGASIADGSYAFTLEVTDSLNATATRTYTGEVQGAPSRNSFTSYALPLPAGPNGITSGLGENLWFTALNTAGQSLIGQISTAGVITTTDSVNPSGRIGAPSVPMGGNITAGSAGALWALEQNGSAILELDVSGAPKATYFPPTTTAVPTQIISAQDGSIWYSEAATSKIGHLTAGAAGVETPTPSPNSNPLGLVEGPQNFIVFTEPGANKIGFISESGTISSDVPLSTPNSFPENIVLGPDYAFWFTESNAHKIGRLDYNQHITETSVSAAPGAITLGPDGALYFTESGANKIGRITISGQVTEYAIPDANSTPTGVAAGQDGSIWFTENGLSRIGRLSFLSTPTAPQVEHLAEVLGQSR